MKFFLDANIPYSTLNIFKKINLEVIHARDIGLGNADDKKILGYTIKSKSILVTKDLEFGYLLNSQPKLECGIVILRLPSSFNASQFAKVLMEFLTSVNIQDLEKSLTIVKLGRYRIRKFK